MILSSQNTRANNSGDVEQEDEFALVFVPKLCIKGSLPITVPYLDGTVSVTYLHGVNISSNGSAGKFTLGRYITEKYHADLSGGIISTDPATEGYDYYAPAKSYVESHINEFKAKAYAAIPEAKKATKFFVLPPSTETIADSIPEN